MASAARGQQQDKRGGLEESPDTEPAHRAQGFWPVSVASPFFLRAKSPNSKLFEEIEERLLLRKKLSA